MPAGGVVESTRALLSSLAPLDWLLLALAAWSILRGFLRGAIRELFSILAFLVALTVAYREYAPVAQWLERWIAPVVERDALALLLVALSVFLAVTLAGSALRAIVHLTGLGLLDRLAGAVLGAARAALVGTILVTALTATPSSRVWLESSRFVPYLATPARLLAQLAPEQLESRIRDKILRLEFPGHSLR